ncbi:MAG: TIGR01777 family protein [Candidatus Omnitrophica bacterium]|nr:TIGR01777 family protein [Candidatus Omnitrophota bacterium]
MRLLVAGGTGFIGAPLCRRLAQQGYRLFVYTRSPGDYRDEPGIEYLPLRPDTWTHTLAGIGGVINLAGEPIAASRWSAAQKQLIRASRVEMTRHLVEAMAEMPEPPPVLVSASAVGYYGARGDEELAEADAPGRGFLAETCQAWEAEARRAEALGVRVVRLRIGLVLGADGGALAKMVPPFRAYVGGPLGSGRQWVSWVHRDDVIGLVEWALTHPELAGAVNATAPQPVRMAAFCRELGRALRRPSWAPAPAPVLRLLLGEMADLLVTGQRVVPQAALQAGYPFRFPSLAEALSECLP